MMGLTPMQARTLELIRGFIAEGVSPSVEELRVGLGIASKSGVVRLLRALKERGAVDYVPHRARSIRLMEQTAEELLPTLHGLSPFERRKLLAILAGLVAGDDRDGGKNAGATLHTIAGRLAAEPRSLA